MLAFAVPPALLALLILGTLFAIAVFGDWLINLGFAWYARRAERRARHLATVVPPAWPSTEAIAWAAAYQELQLLTRRVIALRDPAMLDAYERERDSLPFETGVVNEFIERWRGRLPARESKPEEESDGRP